MPVADVSRTVLDLGALIGLQSMPADLRSIDSLCHWLKPVLDAVKTGVVVFAADETMRFVNPDVEMLTGWTHAELQGKRAHYLFPEHSATTAILTALRQGKQWSGEGVVKHAIGGELRTLMQVVPVVHRNGNRPRPLGAMLSFVEQHNRHTDRLTKLQTRDLFTERVDQAILLAQRQAHSVSVVVLDIRNMEQINQAFGRRQGDRAIAAVAERLVTTVRRTDTVARLGSDKFGILLHDLRNEVAAAEVASKLIAAAHLEMVVPDGSSEIKVTAGIAMLAAGDDAAALIMRAERELATAKTRNEPVNRLAPKERRSITAWDVQRAIGGGQLRLYYQPQVHFRDGRVAAEALVRWEHPGLGQLLGPNVFVPTAEDSPETMRNLTRWVMQEAVRQVGEWRSKERLEIPVSVNLSAKDLGHRGLRSELAELLDTHQVAVELVKVEVTEGAIMADPAMAVEVLREIRDIGVKISVDDYGTGRSALQYIQTLPLTELKIDKSFVSVMLKEAKSASIVRSTIELAHDLELEVVAEGVETAEQWNALADLGCDWAQGYFLAKPMPADQMREWIRRYKAPPVSRHAA